MSVTMARQGGQVQLEQSNMRLALNMAKMAKGGFSRAMIEEMQQRVKKPRAEVQEEKKPGVEFPGHQKVKPPIESHLAIVYKNHTAGCLPCQMVQQRNRRPAGGQKNRRTSSRPGGTSSRNATRATRWRWGKPKLWNRWYAIQVCVYAFSTSQHSIFQP